MENNNKKGLRITIILAIILLLIVLSVDVVINYVPLEKGKVDKTTTSVTKKEVTITDEGIAEAVDKVYDATVIVKVYKGQKVAGWGSGFVYKTKDDKAYILTNHHVVDSADQLEVTFTNNSSIKANLIGSDEYNDVAVLTVPKDKILAVAEIGKSENLRVGDTVFAVGTPVSLDYSFTVTRGILSGKNRLVQASSSSDDIFSTNVDSWYMSLLQIDASINSGNSGGPLANCNGEIVGINNSKLSSSYSSTSIENIGFAIPIEDALSVADEIENGKKEGKKPVLGVSMITLDAAEYNNITVDPSITTGALVADVSAGSNADRAGIKKGDVIVEFNGNNIDDYRHLKYYLYKCKIGDKVKIKLIRGGLEKVVEVTLKG